MTRAFVVGNGPSLKRMCLDKLVGEVTFAMNRIDLLYEPAPDYGIRGTVWRPTYYLFIEWILADNPSRMIRSHPNADLPKVAVEGMMMPVSMDRNPFYEFVLPYHVAPGVEQCFLRLSHLPSFEQAKMSERNWRSRAMPNAEFVPVHCKHAGMYSETEGKPTDWHLPVWCHYGGTMNVALQFAFAMGFEPVYVIGCDLGIQPVYRNAVADPNHFHPDYWTWEDNPLTFRDSTLLEVHTMAQRAFDKAGRRLYNAGVGGELDVHPRVDFASLFADKEGRSWPSSIGSIPADTTGRSTFPS